MDQTNRLFVMSRVLRIATKLLLAFAVLLAMPTAKGAVICMAGVASFPTLDPLSNSAAVGELTADCGGGAAGDPPLIAIFQAFYNVPLLTTVTPLLSDGLNSYTGSISSNSVAFIDVSIDPLGDNFVLQNVFVDASLQPENFLFAAFLSITAAPVMNANQAVAINGVIGNAVPEPSVILLLLMGLCLVVLIRRRGHGKRLRFSRVMPHKTATLAV